MSDFILREFRVEAMRYAEPLDDTVATLTANVLSTPTATSTTSTTSNDPLSITSIIPTATPSTTQAPINFDSSHSNDPLFTIDIDNVAVSVICRNCSTHGALFVSGSDFYWDDNILTDIENKSLGIKGGHFQAHAPAGLGGRVELEMPVPQALAHSFDLVTFPVYAFAIPYVGNAGVFASIEIPFSIRLDAPANVSFGFEWSIPGGSYLDVNIGDMDSSSARGFTEAEGVRVSLLPIQVDVPGLDLVAQIGLQFNLHAGIDLADNDVVAEVGVALNFPVTIEEVQLNSSNADNKCNPIGASSSDVLPIPLDNSTWSKVSKAEIGDYTNFIPNVGANLVVYAQDALRYHGVGIASPVAATLVQTSWSLSTTCINNHPATATSTATTAGTKSSSTSSPTSASSKSHNDAGRVNLGSRSAAVPLLAAAVAWSVVAF